MELTKLNLQVVEKPIPESSPAEAEDSLMDDFRTLCEWWTEGEEDRKANPALQEVSTYCSLLVDLPRSLHIGIAVFCTQNACSWAFEQLSSKV